MKQKGAAIRSTFQALQSLKGDEAVSAVKEALRPEIRAQIEPTILPVAWYPVEVSAAIHVAIRDVVGGGKWDLSHALGVEASRIDFTGVYRVFLRAAQYDTIWDRAQRAWEHYNSQGLARWDDRQPGSARGVVTGVSGFNKGIWNAVAGRLESLLQLGGARGASVEVQDATPTSCAFQALWLE